MAMGGGGGGGGGVWVGGGGWFFSAVSPPVCGKHCADIDKNHTLKFDIN